jgi:hypothetical protein
MAQSKYHITRNGDGVGICSAADGNCPLGGEHFDAPEAAFKHLEVTLAAANEEVLKGSKKKSKSTVLLETAGTDPKLIRDQLRAENPGWDNKQVHMVYNSMVKAQQNKNTTVASVGVAPSAEEAELLLTNYTAAILSRETAQRQMQELHTRIQAYNSLNAAAEGRSFYYAPGSGGKKTYGVNPSGNSYFDTSDVQKSLIQVAKDRLENATLEEERAQTHLEKVGLGHLIPDDGNVLRVRTQAQKWLMGELSGQISDGMWENSPPQNHWQVWSDAKVVVDPRNAGRNFHAAKSNYQLNSKELLSVVGDEMQELVTKKTEEAYDKKIMDNDLADLRKIFKTQRPRLS